MPLAIITPIEGHDLPPFGGGHPARPGVAPPIHYPPLPPGVKPPVGVWPPPPQVDGGPVYPIAIPIHPIAGLPSPGHELPEPEPPSAGHKPVGEPGQIWPPLNPSDGVQGTVLLLVWVVGTDRYRWVVVSAPTISTGLPGAEPK